mmetsp:Transcript_588/g.634  ORF Transcript_588/g.634 Transcript_588/m.634 type:complete len:94 (+) Transcript_588:876-1157(+)
MFSSTRTTQNPMEALILKKNKLMIQFCLYTDEQSYINFKNAGRDSGISMPGMVGTQGRSLGELVVNCRTGPHHLEFYLDLKLLTEQEELRVAY